MKKTTRILLIALCICMLLPLLVSCGKEKDSNKSDYETCGRETFDDGIPEDYDLENQTVGVFYAEHIATHVIGKEDETDIVFSKIHERNLKVAERLNVELDFISSNTDWTGVADILRREISTMSTAYEIVFTSNTTLMPNKLFNYFHNFNDSNYIDISRDWWYEDAIMELSVDDNNYRFLYGDILIDDLGDAGTIYYNKPLYEQYLSTTHTADEPYQYVLDGKWTMELFTQITKKAHIEKGGDGSADLYGFMLSHNQVPHYYRESIGLRGYERDASGMPVFTLKSEKAVDFTEKLYELFFENDGVLDCVYSGNPVPDAFKDAFTNGKVFFEHAKVRYVLFDNYREMKDDFGILPYPKWDEAQEEYISFVHNSSTTVCCPVSADIDRVNEEMSAIIEALASESYRSVSVPFYESALKAAYNRDDLSAQMIDIIMGRHDQIKSKLTKNFVFEYNNSLGTLGNIFYSLMYEHSKNFISKYDSLIAPAEQGLKDLLKQYKDGTI